MDLDFKQLGDFLYNANIHGYAGGGFTFDPPQRPGFDELEYRSGDWLYHDSYSGHYFAPGQETVYYKDVPVWAMSYAGGMKFEYHGNKDFTRESIEFLKKALLAMTREKPFRGPELYTQGDWRYLSSIVGGIKDFTGNEKIYYKEKLVFEQNFIGGVIIN